MNILDVIAIAISGIALIISTCTYFASVRRDRRRDTLEAYNRLQNEVFDHLNAYSPEQIRDIAEDTRSIEYKTLSGYLASIEHFCAGVNARIYDEKIVYALGHGYFDGSGLRKRMEPLLDEKNSHGNTSELYYVNIYAVMKWFDRKNGKNK